MNLILQNNKGLRVTAPNQSIESYKQVCRDIAGWARRKISQEISEEEEIDWQGNRKYTFSAECTSIDWMNTIELTNN